MLASRPPAVLLRQLRPFVSSSAPRPASLRVLRSSAPRHFSASAISMMRVSELIKHDHRELEDAYQKILSTPDYDEKTRWQNQFTWELARHSIGEELVVYPAMEKHLANGTEMADKDRKEHLAVKEKLYKFQGLKAEDPDFEPTLKSLWDDLGQHIKEEEESDLVALEDALEESTSEGLATSFGRTKKFIPTRSHPSAPDKPPFETVAGLMAAPLDHLQDLFRKFPKESESTMPP